MLRDAPVSFSRARARAGLSVPGALNGYFSCLCWFRVPLCGVSSSAKVSSYGPDCRVFKAAVGYAALAFS